MKTILNYSAKSSIKPFTRFHTPETVQNNTNFEQITYKASTKSIYNNITLPVIVANSKSRINFSGSLTGISFIKWIEKAKIQPEKLIDIVLKADKYLGEGASNLAYEIPDNASFVFRIPKEGILKGPLEIIKDDFPELNLGQTIARIGNVKISKKQTGVPAGIPFKDRLTASSTQNLLTYRKHLYRTVQMPQEAYDELAETLRMLNEKDYSFDMYNPNNLHVDLNEKKFKLVDDLNDIYSDENRNTFASIAVPLFDTWFTRNLSFTEDYVEIWKDILEKSIKAGKRVNLPEPIKDIYTINELFNYAGLGKYKS